MDLNSKWAILATFIKNDYFDKKPNLNNIIKFDRLRVKISN